MGQEESVRWVILSAAVAKCCGDSGESVRVRVRKVGLALWGRRSWTPGQSDESGQVRKAPRMRVGPQEGATARL